VAHAGFLRDHHSGPTSDVVTLVRGLLDAGDEAAERSLAGAVAHVHDTLDTLLVRAPSFAEHRALIRFVTRLTLAPRQSREANIQELRAAGYSDREVHDVVNVACCFAYMNRLADGLGVTDPGSADGPWALELMGAERCAAHRAWAAGTSARS